MTPFLEIIAIWLVVCGVVVGLIAVTTMRALSRERVFDLFVGYLMGRGRR